MNNIELQEDLPYMFWLHTLPFVSSVKKIELHKCFSSAKNVYKAKEDTLKSLGFLSEKNIASIVTGQKDQSSFEQFEKLKVEQIDFIPWNHAIYPAKLREIDQPPYALFVKGKLPHPDLYSVAIIGARKCTNYGKSNALECGRVLSEAGIQIISGLAYGVDGYSQRGAILGGTPTFSILGCGVEMCYPKENMGLYQDIIAKGGGIISEYPPGTPPLACNFPQRNRIISGLSNIVVVIEAKERSGTSITASFALEQGKDIYALPGPINSSYSKGCHQLIRQGAGIIISPKELLDELNCFNRDFRKCINKGENVDYKKTLDTLQNMVYSQMCFQPKGINELIEETNLTVGEIMDVLVSLELEGYIKEISKNNYISL